MSDAQKKIYVCNLSASCTTNDLQELFRRYGEVTELAILPAKNGHRFAFVHMLEKDADKAIKGVNGKFCKGRYLEVCPARIKNHTVPHNDAQPGPSNYHEGSTRSQPYREDRRDHDVIRAKVHWCLRSVMNHKSFTSAEEDIEFFLGIFRENQIAQQMKMYKGEIANIVVHAFGPYFKKQLLDTLTGCTNVVLGFHKSLKVPQKQQMDLTIRFWDNNEKEVCTRYLSSAILSDDTTLGLSKVLTQELQGVSEKLSFSKILQISTDEHTEGVEHFSEEQKAVNLDVGSCVLYTINYAFKVGINKTSWQIDQFLRTLYHFFESNPAQYYNFRRLTSHSILPAKFCEVRWLENDSMAQEALNALPHLREFVKKVDENVVLTCAESFRFIRTAVIDDSLLPAKLAFFTTLASDLKKFMTEFQTDTPMVPFLYSRLSDILRSLMKRFVKPRVLEEYRSLESVIVTDAVNLLDSADIILDNVITSEMNKSVRSRVHGNRETFRRNCKTCLKAVTAELQARSPIKCKLIKAVSCFDPSIAADIYGKTYLEHLLKILTERKCITTKHSREAQKEYVDVCSSQEIKDQLQNYPNIEKRLDHFWSEIFEHRQVPRITEVMRMVMVLSHGNTHEDSGFPVDVNLAVKNLPDKTWMASRITYDAVSASDDIFDAPIEESLIDAVRDIEGREARKMQKKKEDKDKNSRKRRVDELKERKEKQAKIAREIDRELAREEQFEAQN